MLSLAAAAALTLAGTARAQTAPAVAPNSGKEYALAHGSSFDAPPSGSRNPFWPIGWVPSMVAAPQMAVPQLDVKAENFVVTTISVDYPPLAIINGRSYGVGDRIPVTADKRGIRQREADSRRCGGARLSWARAARDDRRRRVAAQGEIAACGWMEGFFL